jgi:tetratricopeptide (TPR) repeat protein
MKSWYINRLMFNRVAAAFVFIALLVASSHDLYGQNASRQSALAAFNGGQYDAALRQFSELLSIYPRDPLYKYYSGVCLVKLERDPARAVRLLEESMEGSAAIRTVPQDALFFLGRARQMSGDFSGAIKSYNSSSELIGKKASRELGIPDYIRECEEGKGKIANLSDEQVKSRPVKEKPVSVPDTAAIAKTAAKSDTLKKPKVPLPAEADRNLGEKLAGYLKTDTVKQITAVQPAEKETPKPDTARKEVVKPAQLKKETEAEKRLEKAPAEQGVLSDFRIEQKSQYPPGAKVAVDSEMPAGLIYLIQVAVFRNPVAPSYFKGISPVNGFKNPSSGITTYYAGIFRKSADASRALLRVKSLGFRDAFVSAMIDRKVVSADRAAILEKEWGNKPLNKIESGQAGAVRDTVPPTLVFRVEVKRTSKPLPSADVENIKKLAGTRGFDIVEPQPKQYVYLVGMFISYKSASEYADLLVRNGFRDSKVVAYLGRREIPVETARQLFDEY